ncbi:hypothetical protein M409DRAFT_19118 [Zasmidium cellare ATCC 36951]|uniref:Uncharacterized protein n=1 Tax=Zasmidium cellare ATCC 36951 TaxID=1080233 RepID=A0A6A6CVE2_ZASCE|nr:uncharacterized protein M409DRAFT_19118 [Zasmidium cellare ATCC 36951]KAF2171147.1 hypothetical protein M409DRAFT_19118 [Zasmidium cellare ATCC 36951]
MPSQTQVYASNDFSEHEAQDHFAQQFDLANPDAARDSYQRIMHQHTKQQFEMATTSSRRRSSGGDSRMASLSSEKSNGSISSTSS